MFIKLTEYKNGKAIYVNSEYVSKVYCRRSQYGDITVVELVAGIESAIIKVKESVEEVVMALQKAERK